MQTHGKSRARKRAAAQFSDSEDDDDDIPLASSPTKQTPHRESHAITAIVPNGKAESDSDAALATLKRKRASNGKVKAPPKKKVKKEDEPAAMESSASDDEPLKKKRSAKAKVKPESDVEMEDVKPKRKRASNKQAKEEGALPEISQAKKKGKKKEEEDAEEVYRWWEDQANGDGEEKWQTLEHNGVIFPPPYESLPSHVKMKYKGPNLVVFFQPTLTIQLRQGG